MRYPVIVHKDEGSDYGVTVPDFPGVFSGGKTLDEALTNVQDAIETFYEDEEVERLPDPSPLEHVLAFEDAEGGAVVLVDVNFGFLEKKAVPVNITVPRLGLFLCFPRNDAHVAFRYAKLKGDGPRRLPRVEHTDNPGLVRLTTAIGDDDA